jgi:hypothetical protein
MTTKQVFNTSAELDYPKVLPTLDLDFANAKTLDPRITFNRASGGSYVGADGLIKYAGVNEARFDHDPVTGESLGLLIEESRTNLVLNSLSGYGNFFPSNTTVTTGIDAPDGSNTAVRVTCKTSGTTLIRMNTGTLLNSTTYTASFYVRLISGTTAVGNALTSDICDGAGINYLPLLVQNKWVKITYSGFRALINNPEFNFIDLLSDKITDYVLDFWGAQVEQASFPTSYIPTQGSTRTRASDSVQIVGKNFTNFFNKNEGTTLITYRPRFDGFYQSQFSNLFAIRDATTSTATAIGLAGLGNNQLYFIGSSTSLETALVIGFSFLTPPIPSSKRTERAVISYGNDYIRMYQNSIPFSSTSPLYGAGKIADLAKTRYSPSSVDYVRLIFGGDPAFAGRFNCTIQNFRYYPKDLGPQLLKNISQIYP